MNSETPAMEMTEQSYQDSYQELSYRELQAKYEQAQAHKTYLEYELTFHLLLNLAGLILLIIGA